VAAVGTKDLTLDTVVHRIGGREIANFRLKPREQALQPPGISLLAGGTPAEAAEQMRQAFPDPVLFARIDLASRIVASATVAAIQAAGFEVRPDPSAKFPNHARLTHPEGVAGFSNENLAKLCSVFQETTTPEA
jgi:hypothetical protein